MTELAIENLTVGYGQIVAVRDVSVRTESGRIVAILGPNGAGKSSLARATIGTIGTMSGNVSIDGRRLTGMPPHRRIANGVALVPEGRLMITSLSTEENLELGALAREPRRNLQENLASVYDLFPRLFERRRVSSSMLSGGEQQMVAIGRALMSEPKVLILDEPSLGLAPVIVDSVFERITGLAEAGLAVLIVEQNARASLEIADQVHLMRGGRIVHTANPGEIGENSLAALYTGSE